MTDTERWVERRTQYLSSRESQGVGDDRRLMQIAMRESFEEKDENPPSYAMETVETWRDNWYLTNGGTVDTVESGLPADDHLSVDEISNRIRDDWPWGRIKAALTILERIGKAESRKENDGSDGPPTTRWTRTTL